MNLTKNTNKIISLMLAIMVFASYTPSVFADEQPDNGSQQENVVETMDEDPQLEKETSTLSVDINDSEDKQSVGGENNDYSDYFSTEHYWEDSESPIVVNGNKILDKKTGEELYKADSEITTFIANADLVFFQAGDTVYRLHIASGVVDELYTSDRVFKIIPISNITVGLKEYTDEALAIKRQGGQLYDPDIEIIWHTSIVLDTLTGNTTLAPSVDEIMFFTGTTNNTFTTKINGKAIPHANYKPGATGAPYVDSSTCNAHAKYIYEYIWGSVSYGTAYYNQGFNSAAALKTKINGLKVGARITIYPKGNGTSHTFILVAKDDSGFTAYHSNWSTSNDNKVSFTDFTYSEIANLYDEMAYYKPL